ncbi:MAG: hypothetical protein QOF48_3754 [Verrucomicrobiota bacterium]|jgi:hypothetical protein
MKTLVCLVAGILFLSTSAHSAQLPPGCDLSTNGLVGWWKGEYNALDSSGFANHGMLLGEAGFSNGVVGTGFSFVGTDLPPGVKIPASASLDVGTGTGFTLEAWINPYTLNRRGAIFEWNNSHTNEIVTWGVHFMIFEPQEFSLGIGNLVANIWDVNGITHLILAPGGTLTNGGFQHVALTFEKSTGHTRIYRNGQVVAEKVFGSFTPLTTYDLFLGRRPAGDQSPLFSFHGVIDEAAVYNRALGGEEILSIYNGGANGRCGRPPIELSIRTSQTEICWRTELNRMYQVQYRTNAPGGGWLPLGTVQGNGGTNCLTDVIAPDAPRRFYRVQEL